jgi:integrase
MRPSVWVEERKVGKDKKYRVVWREIVFDEKGKPHNGPRQVDPWIFSDRLADKKRQTKLDELEALALGMRPRSAPKTWGEVAALYLKHCFMHHDVISLKTADEPAVNRFTAFIGAERQMNAITTEDILHYEHQLFESEPKNKPGKKLNQNTVRRLMKDLRTVFNYAKREGWIERMPTFHIPEGIDVERVIPGHEMDAILGEIAEHGRKPLYLDIHTGLRVTELLSARGEDFQKDAQEGFWELKVKTLKRRGKDPEKFRVIPIPDHVAQVLGLPLPPGPVFPGLNGGPLKVRAFQDIFSNAIQRLNKEAKKEKKPEIPRTRVHDVRHTWATRFMEVTGDLYGLMRLSGHKDLKSVMKYQHLTRGRAKANLSLDFGLKNI